MVDHSVLLNKLRGMGFRGQAHSWISSFLLFRKPYIDKGGYKRSAQSSVNDVARSVPQGLVLGPVLFLLYVNDLPSSINKGNIYLFVDDTSLSQQITRLILKWKRLCM